MRQVINRKFHMKNMLYIIFILVFCAVLLIGCGKPVSSSASPSPAASAPTPTASTEVVTYDEGADASASPTNENEANAITHEGSIYYLDEKDAAVTEYNEDPPLHIKKEDGSGDQNLNVRGFHFDIIGSYIYLDSKYPDLTGSGSQAWITTRMNLDGSDKKELEYGSMSVRLIPEGEQKFYFTVAGENAIYTSDFPCENVAVLAVNLPDQGEIDKKLGNDKTLQLDINSVSNGSIDFNATFLTKDGTKQYNGVYKITADGKTITKASGTYIDTSSQENESD